MHAGYSTQHIRTPIPDSAASKHAKRTSLEVVKAFEDEHLHTIAESIYIFICLT